MLNYKIMNDIFFSITIPAYKSLYLKEAIDSCLNQTYVNFELIIVDDNSPNDIKSIVNQFSDSRLFYYRNSNNCGALNVVDNWNICLDKCKGDYIICMGDDDKLLPSCLEEYYNLIKKFPECSVFHAWTEIIDEKSVPYDIQEARPLKESALSLVWHRWNSRGKQFIGDFLFKTTMLKDNGGFYKLPLAWGADDITATIAATQNGIANTQVLCFQYRMNRSSITKSGYTDVKIKSDIETRDWYIRYLKTYTPTNHLDELYKSLLMNQVYEITNIKIQHLLMHEFENHPLRLFYWIRKKKKYGITLRILILAWLKSFKL